MTVYVKNTTWVGGGAPGISAAALNNLETQYDDAVSQLNAFIASILTTRGDIPYQGAGGPARLPAGTTGQVLTQGASDPYWSTIASGITSQHDVSISRSLGSIYQNTTGKLMMVTVVFLKTSGGYTCGLTAVSDSAANPGLVVDADSLAQADTALYGALHFFVLPNNYYKVYINATQTPAISSWVEYY
jgi:hypothetical protein